jgi:hypothetical protein
LVDLMADVMIHVDSTREPPLPWPGRSHALVRLGGPRPSKRLLVRYDVVAKDGRDAARLAAHTEQRLAAAGGPHRVTGPPVATLGGRAIFVLGMSRTGTSTTTRLLGLCGAEVGPDERLMQPNADVNAKGFYEHVPLMRINVELLRRMGGSWREPPLLLPGWELDPRFDDLRGEAHRLMAADFAHADTWVFKDPRTALTLPFWRPLVGPIDFVVCHRHPLDVAASLAQRDAVPLEESLRLWTRYCAAAIANTAGTRRIFVGYDEYFDDRDGVLGALTRFAGSPRLAEDPSFRRRAGEWIDADLRHHRSAHSDLVRDPNIGNGVLSLHLLLELAVRSRSREPALAGERGVGAISDALDELAGQITLASDGGRAAC